MVQSDSPARGGSSNPSNPPWIRNWTCCRIEEAWLLGMWGGEGGGGGGGGG